MPATTLVQFAVAQRLGLGPVLLGTLAVGGVGATSMGMATDAPPAEQPQAAMPAEGVVAAPTVAPEPPVTPVIAAPVAAPAMPADAAGLAAPPPAPAPTIVATVRPAAPVEARATEAMALAAPVPLETLLPFAPGAAANAAPQTVAAADTPIQPDPLPAADSPAAAPAAAPVLAQAAAVAAPVPEPAPEAAPIVAMAEPAESVAADLAEPVRAADPPVRAPLALAFADLAATPAAIAPPGPAIAPVAEPIALALPVAPPVEPSAVPITALSFDIAAMPKPLPPAAPGSAFVRVGEGAGQAATKARQRTTQLPPVQRYRQTGNGIEFDIGAVLHGEVLGMVPVRVGQTDLVSVRLGDLLALVEDQIAPEAYARLSKARVANDYVSFSTLRDAGIEVRYDAANDRLILGE